MVIRTVGMSKSSASWGLLHLVRRSFSVSRQAVIDMASKDGELRVFIVAGEVSGDVIGSRLIASLRKLSGFPTRFSGVGGLMMSREGLQSLFPMEDIAVMGIWELLPHLNTFRVRLKQTIQAALLFQPHVIVTVDFKGFSFRLLQQLRARFDQRGLISPLHFHYVAPSFWAWKGGEARLKGLAEFVDHILCILPFEEEVCRMNGLAATFVGHPILEDISEFQLKQDTTKIEWKVKGDGEKFRSYCGISAESTVVTLLPGSRLQEVTRMLPIFSNTLKLLKDSVSDLTAVIHVAPNQHVEDYISKAIHEWPVPVISIYKESSHLKYDAYCASKVALCTSGTVAMELQLARLPCVVAYRAHLLTELFIRYKAKISYISLPNILLEAAVIPEALFQACNPSKLSTLLMELMQEEALQKEQVVAAGKVMQLLYPCGRAQWNASSDFPNPTPSMIAASTILYSARTL